MEIGEGQGWRLVVDPSRTPYTALIGGEGWASELTAAELLALQQAARRLTHQHGALADTLMADEAIDIELEVPIGDPRAGGGGSLWLGLRGDRQGWSLQLVLAPEPGSRGIEGGWSAIASEAFAAALERLRPAEQDGEDQDC
ncbi:MULTISPECIES: DUF1818 family protein [unclassified Cyanobium]|uniref:DUF1818 family protein n=1 Tax=unclassified Cyanobium TaxID=2627006 RepID=UPI0020CEF890|nr:MULTISPECIES: DUF1818 family protein [unclassified Cyanobium]MCP9833487.1 DUF1818 family protein [Cyanobium sp. La Preciosa 7G6]MCP9936252.1 DUF1818 family protein [Cyanobium sp. Aljojuca 7A6]